MNQSVADTHFDVVKDNRMLVNITSLSRKSETTRPYETHGIAHGNAELKQEEIAQPKKDALLRHFVESVPAAFAILDTEMRYLAVSQRFLADHLISENDLIGRSHYDIFQETPLSWREFHKRGLAGETIRHEDPLSLSGGGADVVRWDIKPWFEAGKIGGIFIFSEIVNNNANNEKELQLAAMVFHGCGEAMMITDAGNRIVAVNPAFERITGYQNKDVIGQNPSLLNSDRHDSAYYRAIGQAIHGTGRWQGECWNRRQNGEIFSVSATVSTLFNSDGSVHRRVAIFSDITHKKEAEKLIWQQANLDSLTGLPNRRLFREHLSQEIRIARQADLPLALMFLDLDGFKYVNDTLGHDVGDILLVEAANRLQACVRKTDHVARLGGDEFTVIVSNLPDSASVERIARNILKKLSEPFILGNEVAYVSASIGITLCPNDAAEIEELLKNADQAMYAAKQQGRNRLCFFTQSMQEAAQVKRRLVNDLRDAIERNEFQLVYQPIVELATGIVRKAEVLIRWNHPSRGPISPAEFIPVAEETGMIHEIGEWVFREAADQALQWKNLHHPEFKVSINMSPVQFRRPDRDGAAWADYLDAIGLPGKNIVIEITEGLLLDASPEVTSQLLAFREKGITIALDDFGTGYSSLSYLKKFSIDYLKIDQSFVRSLAQDNDDMVLCEAIIVMAHKLGIKVIAEGVETEKQRSLLTTSGCDYAQGYFFSEPVFADKFDAYIENRTHVGEHIFYI